MRIVHQSATDFYSPFLISPYLALPAPAIAGLLPARCATSVPPIAPEPFTYISPFLIELSADQRRKIFDAARILIDVAVDYTRDLLNDHALNTAIAVFRQAVSGKPMKARNPEEFNAEMDAPILEYMVGMANVRAKYADLDRDLDGDHD